MLLLYHKKSIVVKACAWYTLLVMDKKMLISAAIVGIILLAVGIVSYIIMNQSLPKPSKKTVSAIPVKKMPSETTKDYTDTSGFTISYPDDLTLVTKESTDSASYALIELTKKGMGGSIAIDIADTKIKTTEAWLTQNKYASDSATITEKQLGTLAGTQVVTKDKSIILAIDNGILFMITTTFGGEEDFWKSANENVIKSFSFVQPEAETSGASDDTSSQGGDDVSVEEETVE